VYVACVPNVSLCLFLVSMCSGALVLSVLLLLVVRLYVGSLSVACGSVVRVLLRLLPCSASSAGSWLCCSLVSLLWFLALGFFVLLIIVPFTLSMCVCPLVLVLTCVYVLVI